MPSFLAQALGAGPSPASASVSTMFFSENHAVRVRRHQDLFGYSGHLALGH